MCVCVCVCVCVCIYIIGYLMVVGFDFYPSVMSDKNISHPQPLCNLYITCLYTLKKKSFSLIPERRAQLVFFCGCYILLSPNEVLNGSINWFEANFTYRSFQQSWCHPKVGQASWCTWNCGHGPINWRHERACGASTIGRLIWVFSLYMTFFAWSHTWSQ